MIKDNILDIEKRIQDACDRAGRNRSEVTLVAVSKTKPNDLIIDAYEAGMRHFGENKVQELVQKYEDLQSGFASPANWHLIGHLQRNKVKYIVDKTVLIHSVDSFRLAMQIEEEAAKKEILCDVLIEVNIAEEDTKFGVKTDDVLPLIIEMLPLKHVRIRGLMTVAPFTDDPEKNRKYFKKLHELYVDIKTKNIDNDYVGNILNEASDKPVAFQDYFNILSMGMTGDFEVAIEEGATIVRVGTGIFGERDYSKTV